MQQTMVNRVNLKMTTYKAITQSIVNNRGEVEFITEKVPLTDEELAELEAQEVAANEEIQRLHREFLLSDTDFLAGLSDRPLSDAMREYRQALRDITTHPNWPNLEESDWPVKPEE